MKIIAINGSPRKKWNTGMILASALEGAKEAAPDAEAELINLYDIKYVGCVSCFQCKLLGGPSYGKCGWKDDLIPVLEKALHADVALFGSPIYFSDITGMMRCFLERLFFPNFVYDKDYSSIAPKQVRTAFMYTMNIPAGMMEQWQYPMRLGMMQNFAGRIFGHEPVIQYVNDTYQFKDYSKYASSVFNAEAKARQREEQFPKDLERAREIGRELARAVSAGA